MMKNICKSILSIISFVITSIITLIFGVYGIISCVENTNALSIVIAIIGVLNFLVNIGFLVAMVWLCMKECEDFDERIKALEDKNERL